LDDNRWLDLADDYIMRNLLAQRISADVFGQNRADFSQRLPKKSPCLFFGGVPAAGSLT